MKSIRITYIARGVIPSRAANSIHVMKMSQALAREGHEVTLIFPFNKSTGEKIGNLYTYYGVQNIFRLKGLPFRSKIPGKNILFGISSAIVARRIKSQMVYTRNTIAAFFCSFLGVDCILELHDPLSDESHPVEQWMFRKLVSSESLRHLVVISKYLEQFYRTNYPEIAGKLIVAPDGADPPDVKPSLPEIFFRKSGGVKVGYFGNLYQGRGMEVILDLARNHPDVDFHIAGGTEEDIAFWKEKSNGLSNIVFHGFIEPGRLNGLRTACDVLLAPYQQSVSVLGGGNSVQWMSPLKIFEYMAAGKIIMVSRLPALQEILTEGENCLMCQPDNLNEWNEKLQMIKNNPSAFIHLGYRARELLLRKYTWQARAAYILSHLKDK